MNPKMGEGEKKSGIWVVLDKLKSRVAILIYFAGLIITPACSWLWNMYQHHQKEMVRAEIVLYMDNKMEAAKANKKGSFRSSLAEKIKREPDEIVAVFANMYKNYLEIIPMIEDLDSLNKDRDALAKYLIMVSRILWDELEDFEHRGVRFKLDRLNDIKYYMYKGYMHEAYLLTSKRRYFFKTAYGVERQCR